MSNYPRLQILPLAVLLFALLLSSVAVSAEQRMPVPLSQGRLVQLPYPAQSVFIADPTVANFQTPSSSSVIVFGVKTGVTTLYALDEYDQVIFKREIEVVHDLVGLRALIDLQYPQLNIELGSLAGRLYIRGQVPDANTADSLMRLAESFVVSKQTTIETDDTGNSKTIETTIGEVLNQLVITAPGTGQYSCPGG